MYSDELPHAAHVPPAPPVELPLASPAELPLAQMSYHLPPAPPARPVPVDPTLLARLNAERSANICMQQSAFLSSLLKTLPALPAATSGLPQCGPGNLSLGHVKGRVWKLARDPDGTRTVQEALKCSASYLEKKQLAFEFRTNVREASKCQHANYALHQCIEVLQPCDLQFIIDELMEEGSAGIGKIARHRSGCRIVKKLLERCPEHQMQLIVEILLNDAVALSVHCFGNFVVQHILDYGSESQIEGLLQLLTVNVDTVSTSTWGAAVLKKVLEKSDPEAHPGAQKRLSHALLANPEKLAQIGCLRHGVLLATHALEMADCPQREAACSMLSGRKDELQKSRYGRVLIKFLESGMDDGLVFTEVQEVELDEALLERTCPTFEGPDEEDLAEGEHSTRPPSSSPEYDYPHEPDDVVL